MVDDIANGQRVGTVFQRNTTVFQRLAQGSVLQANRANFVSNQYVAFTFNRNPVVPGRAGVVLHGQVAVG